MKHFYLDLPNTDLKPDMSLRRNPVGFLKPPQTAAWPFQFDYLISPQKNHIFPPSVSLERRKQNPEAAGAGASCGGMDGIGYRAGGGPAPGAI